MDSELAQRNMIDSQIKTWNVFGTRIIEIFEQIDRQNFVPSEYKELAFADCDLDIGNNFKMNSPKLDARILQATDPKNTDKVLEIGTGTGFLTALLSKLCDTVYSIEINKSLHSAARQNLKKESISNAELVCGDGVNGYPKKAPFDVIVVSASSPNRLGPLENQLADGGRMLVFLNTNGITVAKLITKHNGDNWQIEDLFETTITPLIGLEVKPKFKF